MFNVNFGILNI